MTFSTVEGDIKQINPMAERILLIRHYETVTEGSAVICKLRTHCAKLPEEYLTLTNCKW